MHLFCKIPDWLLVLAVLGLLGGIAFAADVTVTAKNFKDVDPPFVATVDATDGEFVFKVVVETVKVRGIDVDRLIVAVSHNKKTMFEAFGASQLTCTFRIPKDKLSAASCTVMLSSNVFGIFDSYTVECTEIIQDLGRK
jgi:hypothetical protein